MLTRIIEGLVLVRNDPKLIGTLTVTVIYNVFGWPFTSMIPVIGQDNLHLGAGGIGILASMDGIGAFCGSIALMLWAKPKHYARLYVGGVVLYLVLLILFALVPNVPLAGAALLFTGVCNAAFSVMQATLIYLAAPPEMRSRLYGVLSVCIGSAPIGFLCLGLLADAVGATAATATSGVVGLVGAARDPPLVAPARPSPLRRIGSSILKCYSARDGNAAAYPMFATRDREARGWGDGRSTEIAGIGGLVSRVRGKDGEPVDLGSPPAHGRGPGAGSLAARETPGSGARPGLTRPHPAGVSHGRPGNAMS